MYINHYTLLDKFTKQQKKKKYQDLKINIRVFFSHFIYVADHK